MRMKVVWPLLSMLALGLLLSMLPKAHAFNLITDIETQTQWTLGSAVDAGTAVVLRQTDAYNARGGQFVGSGLASISEYRMFNLAAGGTFFPQSDGTLRAVDTVKIGLNLAYLFKHFTNQPPDLIKKLVIGPSIGTSLVSAPHVFVPLLDCNYQFSK